MTLGPKIEDHITYVNTVDENGDPVTAGKCASNVKVKMTYKDSAGVTHTTSQDIGGWGLVNPNAMKTPEKK